LRISNPIAVLVQCEGLVVLAVAQVNQLKFAGNDNLSELPIHLLVDPTARVDSQILRLVPVTLDDDPTQVHDWCWSLQMEGTCDNIPGRGVHPINPSLSVQNPGKPTFLFESTFLVTLSCNLFQELRPLAHGRRNLPVVRRLEYFPYQSSGVSLWPLSRQILTLPSGGACFICEVSNDSTADLDGQANCSRCGTKAKLDWKNTQRILEHMGAHILHDTTLNTTEERCGLCLRPAPLCCIYLMKGHGAGRRTSVDQSKSVCPNLVRFNYKNAAQSSKKSPCSNIPVTCSLCQVGSPAVWTYCLHSHYRAHHNLEPAHFPKHPNVELSQSEKDGMKRVWGSRFKQRKAYFSKKKHDTPLAISEAHRSRLLIQ
ncbi:hypothetical protein EDB86DRAFT_2806286, partial [Lactarius hatsudake]